MRIALLPMIVLAFSVPLGICGEKKSENKTARYFTHQAREDRHGVIAPWCDTQNGSCDFRVRVSAETLKRYPWADAKKAVMAAPEYVYFSQWNIDKDGKITLPKPYEAKGYAHFNKKFRTQWLNGDLGSRYYFVVPALMRYYAYSGDPMGFGPVKLYSDYILDYGLTPEDHPWPKFPISCPTAGNYYGKSDTDGFIQTDYAAELCRQMLMAGRFLNEPRYIQMAKHWGDVYAAKCNSTPGKRPWPRYANPQNVPWGKDPDGNLQTGGSVAITRFLDELVDMGYTGKDNAIVKARDVGDRYLKETLLSDWSTGSNWGYFFWDWKAYTLNCTIPFWGAEYMMDNSERFPGWHHQVPRLLKHALFEACISPVQQIGVYSGAWSYTESSSCCGDSNDYAPQIFSGSYLKYAAMSDCKTMRELGRRQILLSTYDVLDTGVVVDCISGKVLVAKNWFKIAHPLAMEAILRAMGWLPESLGAARENHIMRTADIVRHVTYDDGCVQYTVADAKAPAIDVLRLAFRPTIVTADGKVLESGRTDKCNGYELKDLPGGDCLVTVRHDGLRSIKIEGDDPQVVTDSADMKTTGDWNTIEDDKDQQGSCLVASTVGSTTKIPFEGNQVRLIGRVAVDGGRADVYLDGKKMMGIVDCWAPKTMQRQVLYFVNGLKPGKHVLKIVVQGKTNPIAKGTNVYVDALQSSAAECPVEYGSGGGSSEPQRVIFGYPGDKEYVDTQGNHWAPALEVRAPLKSRIDGGTQAWWKKPRIKEVADTKDPVLYQHGMHARDFTAHFTVKPDEKYHVRIKLAESRNLPPKERAMTLWINGELVAFNMDIEATADGRNKAVDLVVNNVKPKNGLISIRFSGSWRKDAKGKTVKNEAIAKAIEIGPGYGGEGAVPVEISKANVLE
ncbi:MAG: hypothetical protein JXM70_23350 [Pirellulales bacterium]|nr:hypothetical protein [Pirellulales bacterium]